MKNSIQWLLLITFFSSACIGESLPQSGLDYHRKSIAAYTAENFDLGGPISHYVWKQFPAFYPHMLIARRFESRKVPLTLRPDLSELQIESNTGSVALGEYVKKNPYVDAMLILHDGKIVFESYPRMAAYERHLAWSVTKVVVSTALAALEHRGEVDMSKAIEHYVVELKDTAWAGTSVQDIADMSSGIACLDSDGYQDSNTCVYRYEESLGIVAKKNKEVSTLQHLQGMRRDKSSGQVNEYVSANTYVLGMVIESVTSQPLWIALQTLIWDRIGAESDALLTISPQGFPYSSGGLVLRLRDLARFGEIFTRSDHLGVVGGAHFQSLVSANKSLFTAGKIKDLRALFGEDLPSHAAWQWDYIWGDGDMFKEGYSGQGLYVSPRQKLVIAFFGTHGTDWSEHELLPISRQLASVFRER